MFNANDRLDLSLIVSGLRSLSRGPTRGSLLAFVYGHYKLMTVPWWMRMAVWMIKVRLRSTEPSAWCALFAANLSGEIEQAHMDGLINHILNGKDPEGAGGYNQKELDIIAHLLKLALEIEHVKETQL